MRAFGGTGHRGPPIATFSMLADRANSRESSEIPGRLGQWVLAPWGLEAGFGVASSKLTAPDARPPGLIGIEATGAGEVSAVMPWFGGLHDPGGIGSALVHVGGGERVSVRAYSINAPRTIRIFSAGTPLTAGRRVSLHAVLG